MAIETTRRAFVRGSAWATPVLMFGANAPAFAGSPVPRITSHGKVFYNSRTSGTSSVIDGTSTSGVAEPGVIIKDAASTSAITLSIWLPVSTLTITPDATTTGWTNMTLVAGSTASYNGTTFYEYKATYTGTVILAPDGSATVPFKFNSNRLSPVITDDQKYFKASVTGSINGQTKTSASGFIAMQEI